MRIYNISGSKTARFCSALLFFVGVSVSSSYAAQPLQTGLSSNEAVVTALPAAVESITGAESEAQAVYSNCAACHGAQGEGQYGPRFAGNANLQQLDYVLLRILMGTDHMPPFAEQLPNGQIATVADYIRSHWGNDFGTGTTAEQVEKVRQLLPKLGR